MNPCNYLLKLPCMSQELVPFLLPVVSAGLLGLRTLKGGHQAAYGTC